MMAHFSQKFVTYNFKVYRIYFIHNLRIKTFLNYEIYRNISNLLWAFKMPLFLPHPHLLKIMFYLI